MNLNQLTIPSANVETSKAFYQALGLVLIVDSSPRYVRFECPDGESTFSIHLAENVRPDPGLIIYFECGDLDLFVAKLGGKGIHIDSEPLDQRWLWREAHLSDPDGHHLCLYHAGENRRNPPWRLIAVDT